MMAIMSGKIPDAPMDLDGRPPVEKSLWELCKRCWHQVPLLRPRLHNVIVDLDNDFSTSAQKVDSGVQLNDQVIKKTDSGTTRATLLRRPFRAIFGAARQFLPTFNSKRGFVPLPFVEGETVLSGPYPFVGQDGIFLRSDMPSDSLGHGAVDDRGRLALPISAVPLPVPYDPYNPDTYKVQSFRNNTNDMGKFDVPVRGYAVSKPPSEGNDRDRDFGVGKGPQSLSLPSVNEERASQYSDARLLGGEPGMSRAGMPPQSRSPTRSDRDMQEIAKGVAELLLPQLRANESRSPPPRALPNPYGPSINYLEPFKWPGPPQYERF